MKQIHLQEKQQFEKLFKQEHIDGFNERYKILEVFLQTESHITVEELVSHLDENGCKFDPQFVRETLKLLCRFGFARRIRFDNGVLRYEHRHLGQHHDHMICTKCKKIIEFEEDRLEKLQIEIAASRGFHLLQHKMEIYGICSECLKTRFPLMPLTMAKPGERLVLRDFNGGSGVRLRLLTMGLRPGDEIEVISNSNQGQIAIAVDFKRFALGRGLAQKILVEPLGGGNNPPQAS
jgi:Fur family ferric uptake transcriptional regulator